ncbi:MAG: aldolase, partial [Anaerolineae bacterium]|nr:aldolase [Anaerolineae bacterium]
MHGIELREALHQQKRVYGFAVEGYGQPRWPRFFSDIGLDYVFIDSEHTPQNRETIAWACQAYAAFNIAPLVRIPTADASQVAMALDAGAHGVIVPYVETVEQVRAVVGAVKYRPLKGLGLEAILAGHRVLDEHTRAYLEDYNRHASLIIMIESPAGIQNLPELLAVGGVDGVLIGPHDLSVSHSVPEEYDSPVFVGAVQRIIGICQSHRTSVGIHYVSGDTDRAAQWIAWGFNLICHRSDTLYTAGGA